MLPLEKISLTALENRKKNRVISRSEFEVLQQALTSTDELKLKMLFEQSKFNVDIMEMLASNSAFTEQFALECFRETDLPISMLRVFSTFVYNYSPEMCENILGLMEQHLNQKTQNNVIVMLRDLVMSYSPVNPNHVVKLFREIEKLNKGLTNGFLDDLSAALVFMSDVPEEMKLELWVSYPTKMSGWFVARELKAKSYEIEMLPWGKLPVPVAISILRSPHFDTSQFEKWISLNQQVWKHKLVQFIENSMGVSENLGDVPVEWLIETVISMGVGSE